MTDREAAEKIMKLIYDPRYEGKLQYQTNEMIRIIADTRPEPSPDAEKLARDIVKMVFESARAAIDYGFYEEDISNEILPLLTNFKPKSDTSHPGVAEVMEVYNPVPQSVVVDVEECAIEIKTFVQAYPGGQTLEEFEEIIYRHITDAPEPTKTEEDAGELVKVLRAAYPNEDATTNKAADTIEALSEKLAASEERVVELRDSLADIGGDLQLISDIGSTTIEPNIKTLIKKAHRIWEESYNEMS